MYINISFLYYNLNLKKKLYSYYKFYLNKNILLIPKSSGYKDITLYNYTILYIHYPLLSDVHYPA